MTAPTQVDRKPATVGRQTGTLRAATLHGDSVERLPTEAAVTSQPMSAAGPDAAITTSCVGLAMDVPMVPSVVRGYFSTYMLWAANDFTSKAAAIEERHSGGSRFDIEHRACVISGIMNAVTFLEAMVNELFQEAADFDGAGDSCIGPLAPRTRRLMSGWWAASGRGFERVLDKVQILIAFADKQQLDPSAQPFQDASQLMALKNALVRYRSADVPTDVARRFVTSLRGRFADNALMTGRADRNG